VLVPLFGTLVGFMIGQSVNRGHDDELLELGVMVIGVFFFSGLMFRAALLSEMGLVAGFAAAALASEPISTVALKSLSVLLVTGTFSAFVYRDVELSYRQNFLYAMVSSELISVDALTGLRNRRALDEHLRRIWGQGQRDRRTFAVLMIDIDHFKAYNDAHGHQAGDAALRHVARLLAEFARRPLDMAGRYGGEEFALLLYDIPLPQLEEVAERIRYVVREGGLAQRHSQNAPQITVSIGAGLVQPMAGRTPQGAVQFADEALYAAKQRGRNRIVVRGLDDYMKSKTGTFRGSFG